MKHTVYFEQYPLARAVLELKPEGHPGFWAIEYRLIPETNQWKPKPGIWVEGLDAAEAVIAASYNTK